MSLCFLVEGAQTEKRIYRAWVPHVFPSLAPVTSIGEMTASSYCVIAGGGIPLYLEQIRNVLLDIKDNPAVAHLFICIDAEDLTYEARIAEIEEEVRSAEIATRVRDRRPSLKIHAIVQHCCIETWFLGHTKMLRRSPNSTRLVAMKAFYDVSQDDPEQMGRPPGYLTRASFHLSYLQEMLREQGKSYTKTNPGIVVEKNYLDALHLRCTTTGHLPSLQKLFATWSALPPASSAP